MKKILASLFILSIYIALLPSVAKAQTPALQLLEVSPVINDIQLTPGKVTAYPLTITNNGDKPVGFHIEITGIDITNGKANSSSSQFLSWIQTNPADLVVPPHDKNTFIVTITTPSNAHKSGYYATLFLTPFISNPIQSSGPIILERIGTLLLATVGKLDYASLREKTHISNMGFSYGSFFTPHSFTFTVTNDYFTHFTAKPFLTLSPFLQKTTTLQLEEKHILPGGSRTWEVPIELHWYTPFIHAQLAISIGNGEQITAETTALNLPLIMLILGGLLLTMFVCLRAKQVRKAITILVTGHD